MQRTIALLMTAALTFCLSACSTHSNLNKETTDSSASSAASESIQESNSGNWNKPESGEVSSVLIQSFADYNGSVPLLVFTAFTISLYIIRCIAGFSGNVFIFLR